MLARTGILSKFYIAQSPCAESGGQERGFNKHLSITSVKGHCYQPKPSNIFKTFINMIKIRCFAGDTYMTLIPALGQVEPV